MAKLSKTALVAGLFLVSGSGPLTAAWSPQSQPQLGEQSAGGDSDWVIDKASNCRAYDTHAGEDDSIAWSGECRDGKLWGPGTLTFFDHGKMFEKVSGDFSSGRLQDGRVSLAWSDGSSYDGELQNGRFNGFGTLIAADGHRYRGAWQDDKFEGEDGGNPDAPPSPDEETKAGRPRDPGAALPTENRTPGETTGSEASQWTFLGRALSANLVAIDGTKLTLQPTSEGVLSQSVVRPDGATFSMTLTPLSARLGTVRDGSGRLIATYCSRDQSLTIAFDDGRSETIKANAAGGITIDAHSPSSSPLLTDWYPEGHAFSRAERDAALKQYASWLASAAPKPGKTTDAARRAPGSVRTRVAAKTHPLRVQSAGVEDSVTGQTPKPIAALSPLKRSSKAAHPAPGPAAGHAIRATRGAFSTIHEPVMPPARLALSPGQPVIVPTSVIHTIDAPIPHRSASECLSVESNGSHWGFRNRCATDVQFSYCLLNSSDRLADCGAGSVAGSVAGNAFSALVADSSISDTNSVRAFSWVACVGGAGEVVPRLVQADPPRGRCVRAASPPLTEQRAEASLHAN